MRRRQILLGLGSAVGGAGCTSLGFESGTPLVVENHHSVEHTVAVTFFRGSAYDSRTASAAVAPDGRHEMQAFVPSSDWDYPFVLDVEVDGEHARTTQHRWNPSPLTVTVRSDGRVQVEDRLRGTPTAPLRQWQNRSSSPTPE